MVNQTAISAESDCNYCVFHQTTQYHMLASQKSARKEARLRAQPRTPHYARKEAGLRAEPRTLHYARKEAGLRADPRILHYARKEARLRAQPRTL